MNAKNKLKKQIEGILQGFETPIAGIEAVRDVLHELSPLKGQPVDRVRWVPIADVEPNGYNPNSQAKKEMGLLYHSIKQDGYTQPIVCIRDEDRKKWVIVDGFHRYFTAKSNPDIFTKLTGLVPIVVIEKDIKDRMASTVRHNRARGKHSVAGMANMVFEMLDKGWDDAAICNELGMEPEELLRLKHVTGFSKLYQNVEYRRAWMTRRQIEAKRKAQAAA